jgi:hypothetical protein
VHTFATGHKPQAEALWTERVCSLTTHNNFLMHKTEIYRNIAEKCCENEEDTVINLRIIYEMIGDEI